MKVEDNKRFVTTVGNFETAEFAVQRHNMRHLMSILRDQLYSDKKLAPIREYSCNAYDANVENGKKEIPIKVTMPTTLFPEFKVRDYGKGVSYEDMKNIFCSYGESTKRNSNEFIGQLGIGSKSGFAYGDNFLVTSIIDGAKTTYNCVLDKSGVGALLHLTTEETDEPTGLEVTIPVKHTDILDFKSKALSFFRYWTVYPEIVGIDAEEINLYKNTAEAMLHGPGWELYSPASGAHAGAYIIMGNISYPMSWELVYDYNSRYNNDKFVPFYNFLTNNRVILRMDIGSIEMSPSREALQYTDKTVNSIRVKVDSIIDSMRNSIQQKIASATSIWEARYFYGKLFGYVSDNDGKQSAERVYRQLEKCFHNALVWNNIVINNYAFTDLAGYSMYTADRLPSGTSLSQAFSSFQISSKGIMKHYANNYNANSLACAPYNKIAINDTNKTVINKSAIRYYLDTHPDVKVLYHLNFAAEVAKKNWFDNLKFETVPLIKMSDIIAEYVKNKPKVIRPKIAKELTRIGYVHLPPYHRTNITLYDTVELDKVTGPYVYAENRLVEFGNKKIPIQYFLEDLRILSSTFKMGIDKLYIIGPRIKENKKFKGTAMTNVDSLINTAIKNNNFIDAFIEHAAYVNSIAANRTSAFKSLVLSKSTMKIIAPKVTNPNGTFKKIFSAYPDIDFNQDTRAVRSIQNIGLFNQDAYNTKVKSAEEKYTKMWSSLYESYRMMKYINIDFSREETRLDSMIAGELANYINMVDAI